MGGNKEWNNIIDTGVGKNVKSIFAKSRTEILAILRIFEGYLELESIF